MHVPFRVLVSLAVAAAALFAQAAAVCVAGDWPGWRGAPRDGVSEETGLLEEWPDGGPPLAWKTKGIGSGYSTPSVAGGKIYVMGTKTDVGGGGGGGFGGFGKGGFGKTGPSLPEYLFCLDATKQGKI